MNNKQLYYFTEEIGTFSAIGEEYLLTNGWTSVPAARDYVTDDIAALVLTHEVDYYLRVIDEGISKCLIADLVVEQCDYTDEEAQDVKIKEHLHGAIEQELSYLDDLRKIKIYEAIITGKIYRGIKREVDKQVNKIRIASNLTRGLADTKWDGSKSEFVELLRKGYKVQTIRVTDSPGERPFRDWVRIVLEVAVSKGLYDEGYNYGQVHLAIRGMNRSKEELLDKISWGKSLKGVVIRYIIIPVGVNGFGDEDRVYLIDDDTYNYLRSKQLVY